MSWSGGGHGGSAGLATGPLSEMTQRGFVAWNGSPANTQGNGLCVSQSLYVMKLFTPTSISITNIVAMVGTVGATLTVNQNLATLYNATGVKQGDSASQDVAWTTTGTKSMAITGGPYVIPAGAFYVSLLSNGTTPATFRTFASGVIAPNAGGAGTIPNGANQFWSVNGTAVTATANLTLASNVNAASQSYWIGVS